MTVLALVLAAHSAGLKVHVDGEGLLRFARGSQAVYASDITLTTSTGVLATPEGYALLPQIHVPSDGIGLKISMDGTVTVSGKTAGRIVLASFGQSQLQRIGAYWTSASRSSIGYPGDGVFGVIRCGSPSSLKSAYTAPKETPNQAKTTIEVSLKSETESPHILLGDIAAINGPEGAADRIGQIDLGTTPIFGATRGITRMYIVAKLKNEGIDTDWIDILCPMGATVVRKGQKVAESDLVSAAWSAAKLKLGTDVEMRSDRTIPDFFVATGDLQFNPIQVVASGDGALVNMEIDVDGKMAERRTVSLVPTVAVASIHAGDPLKIRVFKNGATVEVSGKARSAAKVGQTITVITDDGAPLTGLLKTPSVVEVKL